MWKSSPLLKIAVATIITLYPLNSANSVSFNQIDSLFDLGEYQQVVELSGIYLKDNPDDFNTLDFEVRAGMMGDKPGVYVDRALSNKSKDPIASFRRVLVLYHTGHINKALEELRQLDLKSAASCWVNKWKSEIAFRFADDSLAVEYAKEAMKSPLCKTEALDWLVYMELSRGNLDIADSLSTELSMIESKKQEALAQKAIITGWRGDWKSGVNHFRQIVEASPNQLVYRRWAYTLNTLGRYNEAFNVIEEALLYWPKSKYLLSAQEWICRRKSEYDKASEYTKDFEPFHLAYNHISLQSDEARTLNDTLAFQRVSSELIKHKPNFGFAASMYLNWLNDRGRNAEADSILKYIGENCSPTVFSRIWSETVSADDPARGLEIIDSLLPKWDRVGDMSIDRLQLLITTGRRKEAYQLADELITRCPGHVPTFYNLARIEFYANNFDAALNWLSKVDSLSPNNADALWLRLNIAREQGDREKAIYYLDSLSAEYPHNFSLMWYYREFYDVDEHRTKLETVLNRFKPFLTSWSKDLTEYTTTLVYLDRFSEADSILSAAIAENPNAAELYYYLGYVHMSSGNIELSNKFYSKAQSLDPFNDTYSRALASSTIEGVTLDQLSNAGKPDTLGLTILSVDSVMSLAKSCTLTTSDYGGVLILDMHQHIIRDQYRPLRRLHRIVKIVSSRAKDYYGGEAINFNSWYEIPHLILSRVILPDSRVLDISPSQVHIVATEGSESSDSRTVSWSYPNIDSGAIIEYIIQFEKRHVDPQSLYYSYLANDWDPNLKFIAELKVPADWPIHYEMSDGMSVMNYDSSGFSIYRWSVSDLSSLKLEENCPNIWEQGEWVHFGYEKTWQEEAAYYWNKISTKLDTTVSMRELAKHITRGQKTQKEKIEALFDYVARKIRYVAIEFGEGSIIPRAPQQVCENKYGDCKDKSMVLLSLLKIIGVESYPALISDLDTVIFSKEIPDINHFNHMIAYVPEYPTRFLDPTCYTCSAYDMSPYYKSKQTLIIGSNLKEPLLRTNEMSSEDDTFERTTRMTAKEDGGLKLDIDIEFKNHTALYLKEGYKNADSAELLELVKSYTGVGLPISGKVEEYQLSDSAFAGGLHFGWNAKMKNDSSFMKNYTNAAAYFWFNTLNNHLTIPDTIGRELDLIIFPKFKISEEYTVIPGSKWELNDYRLSWIMNTNWFFARSDATEWEDSLRVSILFELKQSRIPLTEIPEFVRAIDLLKRRVLNQSPHYRKSLDTSRIAVLEKMLEKRPDDLSILLSLPAVYLRDDLGGNRCVSSMRREKARSYYARAIEIDPSNETAMIQLAALNNIDGNLFRADSVLRAFNSKNSMSQIAKYVMAGNLLELGKYEEAKQWYTKVMEQSPSDELRMQLVQIHSKIGEYEDARFQIELLKELRADKILIKSSEYYFYMEQDSLERVAELIKDWPDTSKITRVSLMTPLYERNKNYLKAIQDAEYFLDLNPEQPAFLNNAAWFYALMDSNLSYALELVNRAVELTGECNLANLNTRGVVYFQMGRYEEAKKDLLKCLEDQSASSQTINSYYLGECALKDGEKSKAIKYFNRAVGGNGGKNYIELATIRLSELEEQID